jgi:hypothetical protein
MGVTSLLASSSNPVYAAGFNFTPAGDMLDTDPVADIATTVGQAIDFQITLDTTGLTDRFGNRFPANSKLRISYTPSWDTNELSGPLGNGVSRSSPAFDLGNQNILVAKFSFTVQPGLKNDGEPDFSIGRVNFSADIVNELGNQIGFVSSQLSGNRDVEVQPVPEPLTILGSGVALGFGILFKKEYSKKQKKVKGLEKQKV